ncbi:MAG: gamma-glutamyl-gamma-aminobutyrate hydrolase family protein, partial [Tepidiformaceae bacterium]
AYLRAIERSGGAPVLLAPQFGQPSISTLMAASSGLMLTGGGDVFPGLYGQDAHPATGGVSVDRDRMEVEALGIALEGGLPVLAICRGIQVLNVAMGGSLFQDLPSLRPTGLNHAQTSGGLHTRDAVTHDVRVERASCLATVLGVAHLRTNSMHHQAVDNPGHGVTAVAWTSDGVIEGVEMPGEHWVFGVQWHPEELFEQHEHARQLFDAFVAACGTA